MGSNMKTFKQISEQMDQASAAKKKLAKMKGQQVSFTDQRTGKKVTGTYKGLKQMGGRSYAHVEHENGATRVPPHHIHQTRNEGVDWNEALTEEVNSHLPTTVRSNARKHVYDGDHHIDQHHHYYVAQTKSGNHQLRRKEYSPHSHEPYQHTVKDLKTNDPEKAHAKAIQHLKKEYPDGKKVRDPSKMSGKPTKRGNKMLHRVTTASYHHASVVPNNTHPMRYDTDHVPGGSDRHVEPRD